MDDTYITTAEIEMDTIYLTEEKSFKCYTPDVKDVFFKVWDKKKMIAFLKIRLVTAEDMWDAIETADMVDQELYDGISVVTKFCRDKGIESGTFGYIRTLYVLPEYRRLGIGSMLLKQLGGLLSLWFNIKLAAASLVPAITNIDVKDDYVETWPKEAPYTEEETERIEIMKKNLEVCGFVPTNYKSFSNDKYWCKNYKNKK